MSFFRSISSSVSGPFSVEASGLPTENVSETSDLISEVALNRLPQQSPNSPAVTADFQAPIVAQSLSSNLLPIPQAFPPPPSSAPVFSANADNPEQPGSILNKLLELLQKPEDIEYVRLTYAIKDFIKQITTLKKCKNGEFGELSEKIQDTGEILVDYLFSKLSGAHWENSLEQIVKLTLAIYGEGSDQISWIKMRAEEHIEFIEDIINGSNKKPTTDDADMTTKSVLAEVAVSSSQQEKPAISVEQYPAVIETWLNQMEISKLKKCKANQSMTSIRHFIETMGYIKRRGGFGEYSRRIEETGEEILEYLFEKFSRYYKNRPKAVTMAKDLVVTIYNPDQINKIKEEAVEKMPGINLKAEVKAIELFNRLIEEHNKTNQYQRTPRSEKPQPIKRAKKN